MKDDALLLLFAGPCLALCVLWLLTGVPVILTYRWLRRIVR